MRALGRQSGVSWAQVAWIQPVAPTLVFEGVNFGLQLSLSFFQHFGTVLRVHRQVEAMVPPASVAGFLAALHFFQFADLDIHLFDLRAQRRQLPVVPRRIFLGRKRCRGLVILWRLLGSLGRFRGTADDRYAAFQGIEVVLGPNLLRVRGFRRLRIPGRISLGRRLGRTVGSL